jgi:hypothetical protein
MALSEDSRSLLQLLLARGKSYSDIADLLGVDESEVRGRAHGALTEINGSDPDRDTNLTDYLLGQADPIDRASTARTLADNPDAYETASDLSAQLKLLVPGATLPKLDATAGSVTGSTRRSRPAGKAAAPRQAKTRSSDGQARPGLLAGLNMGQRRLLAVLVLAAILVAVVVLVLLLINPGGDSGTDTTAEQPAPTTAVLRPVEGEQGRGVVNFGFSGTELAAQLQFNELQPSAAGQSYVVWLFGSGGSFPINQSRVTNAGAISGQVPINQALLCFIAGDLFPDMRLSRVDDDEMARTLQRARQGNGGGDAGGLPDFTGELVLEGPIVMPQEAKDEILPVCNA